MKVYILYSNWMYNGDNAVNEVIGLYDCLRKAQQALASKIYSDLTYHPYENIWGDSTNHIEHYDIFELSNMFYDDPSFNFPVRNAKLWNGDDDAYCEDYQTYRIEEVEIL